MFRIFMYQKLEPGETEGGETMSTSMTILCTIIIGAAKKTCFGGRTLLFPSTMIYLAVQLCSVDRH